MNIPSYTPLEMTGLLMKDFNAWTKVLGMAQSGGWIIASQPCGLKFVITSEIEHVLIYLLIHWSFYFINYAVYTFIHGFSSNFILVFVNKFYRDEISIWGLRQGYR
jgi:hypothetical protein